MNKKAELFDQFLQEREIPWFTKEEISDELNSVVYRATLDAAAQQMPFFVVLDDSVFTIMRLVVVNGSIAEERRADVEKYLGELNGQFKIFKYYVSDADGAVYMDISLPSVAEKFDPELLVYLIGQVLLPHVEEFYPTIMEKVWGKKEAKKADKKSNK